jgi:hypothetical protein
MTRTASVSALSAALFVCLLTSSVQAQVTRTFVSGTGSDSNPCTYADPCRFFTAAIAALPSGGGEVDVLDPGSYGQVTIAKPVSIIGRGWTTITATPTTAAISITNALGSVSISGVQLDGGGSGQTGISFTGEGTLEILDSVVRKFAGNGINLALGSPGTMNVTLRNVALLDNTGNGLSVNPAYQNATVNISAENVTANGNGNGVYINANGAVSAVFDHLVASRNLQFGFWGDGSGSAWSAQLSHSSLSQNVTSDLWDTNSYQNGGILLFDHNKIGDVSNVNGGAMTSDGTNDLLYVTGHLTTQGTN